MGLAVFVSVPIIFYVPTFLVITFFLPLICEYFAVEVS